MQGMSIYIACNFKNMNKTYLSQLVTSTSTFHIALPAPSQQRNLLLQTSSGNSGYMFQLARCGVVISTHNGWLRSTSIKHNFPDVWPNMFSIIKRNQYQQLSAVYQCNDMEVSCMKVRSDFRLFVSVPYGSNENRDIQQNWDAPTT